MKTQQGKKITVLKGHCLLISIVLICVGCYKETATPVNTSFSTVFVDADASVPVLVELINQSTGADTYAWTFEGGEPETATDKNPEPIVYNTPGTYTIRLNASNADGSTNTSEKSITVVAGINIAFSIEIIESNYSPVEVAITNTTLGEGLDYKWTFEGGIPAASTDQHPSNVVFESSGDHVITLEVSNGFESFQEQSVIQVTSAIEADFNWDIDFFDDDYEAPVTITLTNASKNATSYHWTFEGGTPEIDLEETPQVTFSTPGTYTITLVADNGKHTDTATRTITILPNTNLRTFTDIKLGINTSHASNVIGAFFSTSLREVFTANQVTADNGVAIDLVFSGLNTSFGFNKFVSPDAATVNGFSAIPNATHTMFINSQELCDCGVNLTAMQFDTMTDDSVLEALTITETANGLLQFDNSTLPRVVLFETHDGRKGAIKIKGYIDDGPNAYIICNIKVQKQ